MPMTQEPLSAAASHECVAALGTAEPVKRSDCHSTTEASETPSAGRSAGRQTDARRDRLVPADVLSSLRDRPPTKGVWMDF